MEGLLYDSHALSLTGWSETETEGGEAEGVGTDGGVSWGTRTVVENLFVTEFEGVAWARRESGLSADRADL